MFLKVASLIDVNQGYQTCLARADVGARPTDYTGGVMCASCLIERKPAPTAVLSAHDWYLWFSLTVRSNVFMALTVCGYDLLYTLSTWLLCPTARLDLFHILLFYKARSSNIEKQVVFSFYNLYTDWDNNDGTLHSVKPCSVHRCRTETAHECCR